MTTIDFIRESNRIEGINREPDVAEIKEFDRFMVLKKVTVAEMEKFVSVYQPDAVLRNRPGLNVRVGNYLPPQGSSQMYDWLNSILIGANTGTSSSAYPVHIAYETLHPFTDGNGRSGRMLWAWQMRSFPLGFLHQFYYQTLAHSK